MEDWQGRSAADLGRAIGAGRIDPVELTENFLTAAEGHPDGARIYARLTVERARDEAAAARDRAQAGDRRSMLDGVPISWKDLFDTAGVATEAGTALLAGRVPEADATVLSHATDAGLVCLGKTHMTELAFSGLGLNPITGSPPNVNDAGAVSGGSSSGAAASVAFGLAAAAIGSDTAGSVRVPAAWNDLVGLRPSTGKLSLRGVVPLAPRFDTAGPLTRSVEDAALLLGALGGGAVDLAGTDAASLRLMNLTTVALDEIRDAPAKAHEDALRRLVAAGVSVHEGAVPEVAEAVDLSALLFASEAYGTWRDLIESAPEKMYPPVRERFRAGKAHGAAEYVAGQQRLERLRAAYLAMTDGYDAVILPTVALLPPQQADVAGDADLFASENLLTLRNTRIGSLLGLCALTLPTGHPSCGLMLMAPPGEDARLLNIGAALERLLT